MKRSQVIELAGLLLLSFVGIICFAYLMTGWGIVGAMEFSGALSAVIVVSSFMLKFTERK